MLLIALLVPPLAGAQSLPEKDAITNAFASVDNRLTFSTFSMVPNSLLNEMQMAQATQGIFHITVNVNQCIPDRKATRAMTIHVNCSSASEPAKLEDKLNHVVSKYVLGPVRTLLSKADQKAFASLLEKARGGTAKSNKSASGNIHFEMKVDRSKPADSPFRENWTFQIVDYNASMATQQYAWENKIK